MTWTEVSPETETYTETGRSNGYVKAGYVQAGYISSVSAWPSVSVSDATYATLSASGSSWAADTTSTVVWSAA